MTGKRPKIQMQLAFMEVPRGEAPQVDQQGTEPVVAGRSPQSLVDSDCLMEEVCQRENMIQAWERVRGNGGSPGVDGMTTDALPGYLREHWPAIRAQLLSGTYRPQPVRRVEIAKPDGGVRKLGIPTVLDRLIQQAVLQVLGPRWDPTFSEQSFGFRPGRSAHQAVVRAQDFIAEGCGWVVDIDLEKFFDRVNHDILMDRIAKRVGDKRLRKLIRSFLNAGVMENGLVSPTDEGTPQGGPLSPLLSNLVLDEFDRELSRRGHRFCRYADDCNIYVRSRRSGERVMASACHFLTTRLKLKVNASKSAVARPWERKFLGFSFTSGPEPRRRIAPQALGRFRERVRELTRRAGGKSVPQMIGDLARYLIGWRAYYGICQLPSILRNQDQWVRHRLRAVIWFQWKNGHRRYQELRRLGVPHDRAGTTAGSRAGPCRMSGHPALHEALPIKFFDGLGLPRLLVAGYVPPVRTAVVRTRMPGGVGGEEP